MVTDLWFQFTEWTPELNTTYQLTETSEYNHFRDDSH